MQILIFYFLNKDLMLMVQCGYANLFQIVCAMLNIFCGIHMYISIISYQTLMDNGYLYGTA